MPFLNSAWRWILKGRFQFMELGNYLGYIVNKKGQIFTKKNGSIMKTTLNDKGYPCVGLSVNGKKVFKRVHRIVAETFIPNPENKPHVNHKDRDRANYHFDNLEWCTPSENVIHSVRNGGRTNWKRNNTGESNGNSKLKWKQILAIRALYSCKEFSQNDIADIFNITQGEVGKIVNHKIWKQEK